MADCKPERTVRRHGGEVWTCACGTVGVTYNGVTVRYSSKDFRRLVRLMHLAEGELFGSVAGTAEAEASAGAGAAPDASPGTKGTPGGTGGGSLH